MPATSYYQAGQTTVYSLAGLSVGSNLTFTVVVSATAAGSQSSSVSIGSMQIDPSPGNNFATASTLVSLPIADLGAGISATNTVMRRDQPRLQPDRDQHGPDAALNVAGAFVIGAGMQLVLAVPSQGVVILDLVNASNGVVQANLGSIAAGGVATVTITSLAYQTGIVTNSWSVTTSSADNDSANNSASVIARVTLPQPQIVALGDSLVSQGQTLSGSINTNQAVTVAFTMENVGKASTSNLVATLQASGGVTPGAVASQTYGAIAPGASATESFTFTAHGSPGAVITATMALADGTNSLGNVTYTFVLPLTSAFTNSSAIIIPDFGPGNPYPSVIPISGVSGVVSGATVTLQGFAHTFPHDVNIMLISPAGQQLVLLAHVGGPYSVTNLTLTFEDSASNSLPTTALSSGAFLPTLIPPLDVFPGISGQPAGTNLSVFDGMSPNGNWSLYVYDDTQGNAGVIANGWTLGLTTVTPVNPPARLGVTIAHAPDPVFTGNSLTYQITVTNLGPSTASNVVLTDVLPGSESFSGGSTSQGSLTNTGPMLIETNIGGVVTSTRTGGIVTVSLGSLSASSAAFVTLGVVPTLAGQIVNTVSTSTTSTDLYPPSTTATDTANVLGVSPAALSAQLLSGATVQITLAGQPGETYSIQESTDLITWTTVFTSAAPTGTITFTDSSTGAARFYRAVLAP